MLLSHNVLVASDALSTGPSEMAAGHKSRATGTGSYGGGEVKQLDIEGPARGFEHRIDVQMLALGRPGGNMMDEIMIKHRVRSDELFNDTGDGRQPEHLTES